MHEVRLTLFNLTHYYWYKLAQSYTYTVKSYHLMIMKDRIFFLIKLHKMLAMKKGRSKDLNNLSNYMFISLEWISL